MSWAELTYQRQAAIDVLLRLMGCTDAKASNCEHVGAVKAMADACYKTAFWMAGRDDLVASAVTETRIRPGVTGHREGKL